MMAYYGDVDDADEARIYLSGKFKTNPQSKYEWIFDYLPKKENLNVLELGCGTGLYGKAGGGHLPRRSAKAGTIPNQAENRSTIYHN